MSRVFLIGPGGVGKTSTGPILAGALGYAFFDLDAEFCARLAPIRRFLDEHGYAAYLRANSALLHSLLRDAPQDSVFALSSGFLIGEDPAQEQNRSTVRSSGVSVLLLPAESCSASEAIVVERQTRRGLGLEPGSQHRIFRERCAFYRAFADHVFAHGGAPEEIACALAARLRSVTP